MQKEEWPVKKAYGISFLIAILFAIGIYQMSYYLAQKKFEEKSEISQQTEGQDEVVPTDTAKEEVITSDTKYIVCVYNTENVKVEENTVEIPSNLIGCTRKELLEKLEDAKLVSFSPERVVVKTQEAETEAEEYEYYLKEENGYVVVLLSDKETVYSNTDIKLENLPEEIQKEIKELKPIKDLSHLYSFLETYTS